MQDDDEDYGYDRDDDPCDHDDRDIDVLSGQCHCWRCGECWSATDVEIEAQMRWEAEYHEMVEHEERRQWWRDLFVPITRPIRRLRESFQIWRQSLTFREAEDDEIPF